MVVFQQHDSLLGDLLRDLKVRLHIHHALVWRIIDYAGSKHGPEDALDVIIQFGFRDFVRLDGFLHGLAVKDFSWLFMIQPCSRCLRCRMCSLPVGENKAREVPVFLQDIVEQVLVFAGIVAVDAVVGAHDRGGM